MVTVLWPVTAQFKQRHAEFSTYNQKLQQQLFFLIAKKKKIFLWSRQSVDLNAIEIFT